MMALKVRFCVTISIMAHVEKSSKVRFCGAGAGAVYRAVILFSALRGLGIHESERQALSFHH